MTENVNDSQGNVYQTTHINAPIIIRQATHTDIKNLEWYGLFRHYRRLFERAYYEQTMQRKYLLVASLNDYPIGRLFIQFRGRRKIIADGRERGYLYSLQVIEFMRGFGIGTKLILSAETLLIEQNYRVATIAVAKTNQGALKLYHRLGYQIFEEDEGKWQYHDHRGRLRVVDEPCYFLEKVLQTTDYSNDS